MTQINRTEKSSLIGEGGTKALKLLLWYSYHTARYFNFESHFHHQNCYHKEFNVLCISDHKLKIQLFGLRIFRAKHRSGRGNIMENNGR